MEDVILMGARFSTRSRSFYGSLRDYRGRFACQVATPVSETMQFGKIEGLFGPSLDILDVWSTGCKTPAWRLEPPIPLPLELHAKIA